MTDGPGTVHGTSHVLDPNGDIGITLIELLIYSVLAIVVLTIVGGFVINSLTVQEDVDDMTGASTTGQLVSLSIESGVRNSSAYQTTTPPYVPGQLLRARSATVAENGTISWNCRAWFYSKNDATIVSETSTTGPVPVPDSADDIADWTLLATGVSVVGDPFTPQPNRSLGVSFAAQAGTGQAQVSTTILPRTFRSTDTGTAPIACF